MTASLLTSQVDAGKPWQDIAADMIEAGKFSIGNLSSDAEVAAASFVFDEGILYLPPDGRAEIVSMLRSAALKTLSGERHG